MRKLNSKIMNQEDLVSVIMPTYNASKYLADSINSILNQTYKNLELLITDDASTAPNTLQLVQEIESRDNRVNILYLKENHGAGYARNKSIERAKGRYIAFCDSDDRWTTDKLEKQIAFMNVKKCALSCASYIIFDGETQEEIGFYTAPKKITYGMMKRDNKVGCLTAIYDIKMLGRKFFMPTIRKRQDWALFLQIIKECKVCYSYPSKPLAYYCVRKNSISSNKMSLMKYNLAVYKKILGFHSIKANLYFFMLFLPTYGTKVLKRKLDSYFFLHHKRDLNQKFHNSALDI